MKRRSGGSATKSAPEHFESREAIEVLSALAQYSRLETFRLLVRYLPYGLPAGDIARLLAIPHNSLSTHLSALEQAGLGVFPRAGGFIFFSPPQQRGRRVR